MPTVLDSAETLRPTLTAFTEFERGFAKSVRGNYWRAWEDYRLTIFRQPNGHGWSWVIAVEGECDYSQDEYTTAREAMIKLAGELGIIEPRRH